MNTDAPIDPAVARWRCTPALEEEVHRGIRMEMALHGFKWDVQVGDRCTLAPFAIVLPGPVWQRLTELAEALARELGDAESELMHRADLWPVLGLPARVLAALNRPEPWTPAAARVIRFDFHPTNEGWRITEANSDVPGGFTEASRYTQILAEHFAPARSAGDPTSALAEALVRTAGRHGRIGLVCAPGYLSDQQVVAQVANALDARGVETELATPALIRWRTGVAHIGVNGSARPLDAVYRFYQGEWVVRLAGDGWAPFFRGGATPVCNPASAVLSESKRLPLVWHELETPMAAWRRLLPRTRPAWAALMKPRRPWVLKGAYSNNGDAAVARSWSSRRDYVGTLAQAAVRPRAWVAQEAFCGLTLDTPLGAAHVCIGVYVVDGRTCGIYGRLSPSGLIDYQAIDVAVLIDDGTPSP